MSTILPASVLNSLDTPTKTALGNVPSQDMQQILNAPFLGGMAGAEVLGMPGRPQKPQLKGAIVALLLDRSMLGAGIDARIAEAVKKAPSSGGINASSVDSKIAKAVEGIDSKIADAVKKASSGMNAASVDSKISKAVEGHLTASNLGKMRLAPVSGGGRRGTKRGKRSGAKRAKRGTKRR